MKTEWHLKPTLNVRGPDSLPASKVHVSYRAGERVLFDGEVELPRDAQYVRFFYDGNTGAVTAVPDDRS